MSNEPGFKSLGTIVPKHAIISGSGTTTIVSAVTGKKISVISYLAVGTEAGTLTFKSDTTAVTGALGLGISGGMGQPTSYMTLIGSYNPDGHFETVAGEALIMVVSAGSAVGHVTYIEV